ncbi:FecR family protein [bacterium A37T11]|nr:FecR family protein [bacterium A37T11]
MQKSSNFLGTSIHDLLANDDFVAWVKHPTDELNKFWQDAQNQYPNLIPVVKEGRQLIQQLTLQNDKPDGEIKERSFQRFRQSIIQDKRRKIRKLTFLRIAATVTFFVMAGIWGWYYHYQNTSVKYLFPDAGNLQANVSEATLRIKGQPDILLNNAHKGQLVKVGNLLISKESDDLLIFSEDNSKSTTMKGLWAQISLPRAQRYRLELADGSKVWLNSKSTIRFAVDFENRRQVEMEGEAYFEIAQDVDNPFKVKSAEITVNVLGTSFNISNYQADPSSSVTLMEGAVNLQYNQGKTCKLIPGQQAYFNTRGVREPILRSVNIKEIGAWRDGLFAFRQDSIIQVMDNLSHWYDIRINYEGSKPTALFTGTIPCETPIEDVLSLLEEAGGVKFIRNDRYITVKSKP